MGAVETLLNRMWADPEATDGDGATALHIACQRGHEAGAYTRQSEHL